MLVNSNERLKQILQSARVAGRLRALSMPLNDSNAPLPFSRPGSRSWGRAASVTDGRASAAAVVRTINAGLRVRLGGFLPWLLTRSSGVVVLLGLFAYIFAALAFATLLYALGDECYSLPVDQSFSVASMLWLSIHTFSTVGYGSVSPRCTSAQLVVLLESYASLCITAVFGGYIVLVFIQPRAKVRFSRNLLCSRDPEARGGGGVVGRGGGESTMSKSSRSEGCAGGRHSGSTCGGASGGAGGGAGGGEQCAWREHGGGGRAWRWRQAEEGALWSRMERRGVADGAAWSRMERRGVGWSGVAEPCIRGRVQERARACGMRRPQAALLTRVWAGCASAQMQGACGKP